MFLTSPPRLLMPCGEPVWGSYQHPQSCGSWEPACKPGAQGRGWLGMLGRGRASTAALTASLEGALVPTDHRSPARGCAICWKSGCAAASQQIQGQFLHPLPHDALLPWPYAPCPSLPSPAMLGSGAGCHPSPRGHLGWRRQRGHGKGRSGEAKPCLSHSRRSFLFLWLSISSPLSCRGCASRRSHNARRPRRPAKRAGDIWCKLVGSKIYFVSSLSKRI